MTQETDIRLDRIRRVFARVDRKMDSAPSDPRDLRDEVVRQVREVYEAAGESIDDDILRAAVDEVFAEDEEIDRLLEEDLRANEKAWEEERAKRRDRGNRLAWYQRVPTWAWGPLIIVALILALPLLRVIGRLFAIVFRF